jgi:tetratricopeptide (TPR) repeat protein
MARHWSLWGPQNIDERLAIANDLFRLARESGDERLAMQAHRYGMMDLLELGDIPGVDDQIEAYGRLAAQQRRPGDLWYAQLFRAMRKLLAGRFDEVAAISADAFRTGRRVGDPNAMQAHVLQMVALRRECGGLEEVLAAAEAQKLRFPAIPGWCCVLAHVAADLGRRDEARETLDDFARTGFRALPLDGLWLGAVALLAETAAMLDDARHAEPLYELLLPYAERNVAIGWASSCAGSAARYLGLLAGLLGRTEEAAAHFDRALEMNERMDAHPWVARTLVDYAELLLGAREEHGRASAHLDRAAAQAEALGMTRLSERIDSVRARALRAPVLMRSPRRSGR